MSTIAIITARGGSKRIPRKNIKDFFGKPMLAYAIEACIDSNIFSEIMVSTEDEEIAEVARQYGAKVPFMRSDKTSSDYATTYDVIEEVLFKYKEMGMIYENVCCVYPCVPFLSSKTLEDSFYKFSNSDFDALMPVCKYPCPVEWAMKIEDGRLVPNDRKAQLIRSQDLSPKYYDVGMFYYCKTDVLLSCHSLVPCKTMAYIIEENECQDIDTPEDWKMAELKYRVLKTESLING